MDAVENRKIQELTQDYRHIKVNGGWFYKFIKRLFDLFSSGLFLIIFGWFILILIFIKWCEDVNFRTCKLDIIEDENGQYVSKTTGKRYTCKVIKLKNGDKDPTVHGAIYTSFRVGINGKKIKFHKIRSMCKGAEGMKQQLLELGINEADNPVFKLKNDPRITKFGKFLRKTSLDELPQIWDVFIGRLSIVGPRSPIYSETEKYTPYQRQRLLTKGGLLCLWQITKNRHQLSFDDWVDLDLKYIENRSLWLDLKIMFKAVWFVITDRSGE